MFNIFSKKDSKDSVLPAPTLGHEPAEQKENAAIDERVHRTGLGKRRLTGVVVSDKMKKTVVVAVERLKLNERYHKFIKVTNKFKAHDENQEFHSGDKVVIEETRPLSKEKRWRVVSKI